MFAVIETGGKQYLVKEKDTIKIEKLSENEGKQFQFDKVLLLTNGDAVEVGRPYLKGVAVDAVVLKQGRGKKISMLRYQSKTRRRRRKGHRQHFTEIEIIAIKK